ncbi:MAG TPA: hypothetical protein VJN69_03160 [Candidatus Acidoferrales bacterium]|nr:hypothetical protein [Candidatus Acidoferrales bacterium]
MRTGIEFRIIWSDSDVVKIRVSACDGEFSGSVEAYAVVGGLNGVAERLSGFPQSPSDMREVTLGAFDRKVAGGGLRMKFHCVDSAGHAFVEATLYTNQEKGGTVQMAVLSVPVEPAAIDIFVRELHELESDESRVAYLQGISDLN